MLNVSDLLKRGAQQIADQREVTLGEDDTATAFVISKMPARPAHRVWRETAHALGHSRAIQAMATTVAAGNPEAAGAHVLAGLLTLNVDFLDSVQKQMFGYVSFTNANAVSSQPLEGAEDTAFEHLEPFDIDELFVRAFAVNFTPSLRRLGSMLLATAEDQNSPSP